MLDLVHSQQVLVIDSNAQGVGMADDIHATVACGETCRTAGWQTER